MKIPYISIWLFLMLIKSSFAQEFDSKSFFEIKVGYMPAFGKVFIQGQSGPWINTLSSEADINNSDAIGDTFVGTTLGITYGKYLSTQMRLGLGVDVDFYNNLSEGRSSRATPLYADFRYNFKEKKSGLFAYAQAGYSFVTGTDWHTGLKSGFGLGYSFVNSYGNYGLNVSIGYNYQVLNKIAQQLLGPPMQGVGYFGPTTVRTLNFAGYKNIAIQTYL